MSTYAEVLADSGDCSVSVKERGPSIWNALLEEYAYYFNDAVHSSKHRRVLEQCAPIVLAIAHTTVIPILFPVSLSVLAYLERVECVVCMYFTRHLRTTWFSIENERLDVLYVCILSLQPAPSFRN